jgi:hypothetical protein
VAGIDEAEGDGQLLPVDAPGVTTLVAVPAARRPRPRVSVVIPCHNHGSFLPESVGSVLGQTFRDLEILIVDAGSTDETAAVAAELAADPRVRLVHREAASGRPAVPRNAGIAEAVGEYVLCLDADDRLDSEFLAECVAALDARPDASIAYGAQQNFGLDTTFHPCGPYDFQLLTTQNCFGCCSLFRRSAWVDAGGYDPGVGYEDWDFWIACGERGHTGVWVPTARWFYRVSGDGVFAKDAADDRRIKARVVLNHPRLYSPMQLLWAAGVLDGNPDALAIDGPAGVIPQFVDSDEPPARLERDAVLLASAPELLEQPGLLDAWSRLSAGNERLTLLVEDAIGADGAVRPDVASLVQRLGDDVALDLVGLPRAVGAEAAMLAQMADAVLSEQPAAEDIFRGLPRYSAERLPELLSRSAT